MTDFAGYANRQIEANSTANDSYGTCDGNCNDGVAPPSSDVDVTFQVDMSDYTGSYGAVNLNGSFGGWCGSCIEMTDADGDGVSTSLWLWPQARTSTSSLWMGGQLKRNLMALRHAPAPLTVTTTVPWR